MNMYVVRNQEGSFFRAKGNQGRGESWVKDLAKARFYTKMGPAKGTVTFFAKQYPQYGTPSILEFTLDESAAAVIDMRDITSRAISSIEKRELMEKRRRAEREMNRLMEQAKELSSRIDRLMPKNK